MILSHAIGVVMSYLVLTILWIFGFGPYAIILKIIRLLSTHKEPPESTWMDATPEDATTMRNPF